MQGDDFVAAGRLGDDSEGATDLIGELGDTVELGAALDLHASEDKIASSEAKSRAPGIDAITVSMAAIFDDEDDDFAGEVDVLACMLDVLEDRSAWIGQGASRDGAIGVESEVEWEFEFSSHGWDAADDVRAVDRAAVPSMGSNHRGFDPN